MESIFNKVVREAYSTYLVEQDEAAAMPAAPAPADAAMPQPAADAAAPQQPEQNPEQIQSGFDVFRGIVINLLRLVGQTAGAIESNDENRLQAVRSSIPDNIEDEINSAIAQITTAEPAKVEQAVSAVIKNMATAPT